VVAVAVAVAPPGDETHGEVRAPAGYVTHWSSRKVQARTRDEEQGRAWSDDTVALGGF